MARTIAEVRAFLDSLIGLVTVDKSDSNLNGQCVSLIKMCWNLLEHLTLTWQGDMRKIFQQLT